MYWSLQILLLIRLCALSVGRRRVYHFIDETKTWNNAQKYCREHYSDLATVKSTAYLNCFCPNKNGCRDAWIGLYNTNQLSNGQCNKQWHWSQPEQVYTRDEANWMSNDEPSGELDCVFAQMENGVKPNWKVKGCGKQIFFLCYDDKKPEKYIVHQKNKTWLQAQRYCRVHHTDLVSGSEQLNDGTLAKTIGTQPLWIGLFRDAWAWSDGSNSSFRNWDEAGSNKFNCKDNKCAKLGNDNQWENEYCEEPHPFICYDDHMVLVKEKKTWEEALVHCRRNYGELAMMTDEHEQRKVQARAKMANTDFVWVGLHFSCFFEEWLWVNGHWVSSDDKNWKNLNERPDCKVSGAMQKGKSKWVKRPSEERYNFVCAVHCRAKKP